jgi:putative endonuclease
MDDRKAFGRAAEDDTAKYLMSIGYTIVTRRFKTKHGEIDLVCLDGDIVVFVEVKARRVPGYVPEESIGQAKLDAMGRAARSYFEKIGENRPHRFDVVAIDPGGRRHHRDVRGNRLTD